MRIVRFLDADGEVKFGVEVGDGVAEVLERDPFGGDVGLLLTGEKVEITRRLAPLIPPNIYCIGRNYAEHAKEGGAEVPTTPVIFMKPTTAVTNPGSPIVIPACSSTKGEVDYEAELAVIIGRPGPESKAFGLPARNIPEELALEYVFGYTIANDVSARKHQKHTGGGQWIRGKSFDTFCPMGPAVVTADEVGDPQALDISLKLNGETMQDDTTSHMIFSVANLVSFISRDTTLMPGTAILTGTPSGVGFARNPAVWLRAGDTVSVSISKIGELTNPVESA